MLCDDTLAKAYADAYRNNPVDSHQAGLRAVAATVAANAIHQPAAAPDVVQKALARLSATGEECEFNDIASMAFPLDEWNDFVAILSATPAAPTADPWPKLDKPAQVGSVRFGVGVSTQTVVETAQRYHAQENTPEKEATRISAAKVALRYFQASLCTDDADYRKDAERYRWLRSKHGYSFAMKEDSPAECGISFEWRQCKREECNMTIDAAIDAAMAASLEGE